MEEAKQFLRFTALLETPEQIPAAAREVDQQLATDPDYVPALMVMGAMQGQKDDPAAVNTYERVIARFPAFAPGKIALASIFVKDPQKHARALELAGEAGKVLPNDPRLAQVLGDLAYARKDFSEALKQWQRSAKDLPLNAVRLFQSGVCYLAEKNTAQAKRSIDAALAAGLEEPFKTEAHKLQNL